MAYDMRPNAAAEGKVLAQEACAHEGLEVPRWSTPRLSVVRWLACLLMMAVAATVAVCLSLDQQPHTPELCGTTATEICNSPAALALVHLGKTGGSTVELALQEAGIPFANVHDEEHADNGVHAFDTTPYLGDRADKTFATPGCVATSESFTHFIVMLRDPVARAVSAFNWMSRDNELGISEAVRAKLFDECFATVPGAASAFAESLEAEGECGDIARRCVHEPPTTSECGHLSAGASFYLKDSALLKVRPVSAHASLGPLTSVRVTDGQPLNRERVRAHGTPTGTAARGRAHLCGPHRASRRGSAGHVHLALYGAATTRAAGERRRLPTQI